MVSHLPAAEQAGTMVQGPEVQANGEPIF
jgi:hypothetical protein